jgi:low temperature requirement protein LtrA
VVSVFVPAPWYLYLWALALLLSLLLPVISLNLGRRDPKVQAQIDMSTDVSPSAVERFGLFTIIVLGEVIVAVVRGVAGHHHLSWYIGGTAVLGMLTAIGLWWIYFDSISHHPPKPDRLNVAGWMYLHLPLTMGIAAVGAAVVNVVEGTGESLPAEVRWLLVGAVSVVLLSAAMLVRTIQVSEEIRPVLRSGGRVLVLSGLFVLPLGLIVQTAPALLAEVLVLLLAPVFFGFLTWLKLQGVGEG